jgi:hypothetical protein
VPVRNEAISRMDLIFITGCFLFFTRFEVKLILSGWDQGTHPINL